MKKLKYILALLLVLVLIVGYSCKEEDITDNTSVNPGVTTLSTQTTTLEGTTTTTTSDCGYTPFGNLTDKALTSLKKVPLWLKNDYNAKLVLLDNFFQDELSSLIVDCTSSDYIDEIAFVIAHTKIEILTYKNFHSEILLENVEKIYHYTDPSNSKAYKYVERVESGNSSNDCDFHTTLRYKVNRDGNDEWIEAPKDIYYWYVVHPVMEDEKPLYIHPDMGWEDNPENGSFWRTYFYDVQDDVCPYNDGDTGDDGLCPVLSDNLQNVEYAWKFQKNDESEMHAVGVVSTWIGNSMKFGTPHPSRPNQPVRIYYFHNGNCGEYADMRTSTGRTALLPSVNVSAYLWDHTWNEFWIDGWRCWDGGKIDDPYTFWWDMRGARITNGDGSYSDVTSHYTNETCNVIVNVKDSTDNPIDNAKVMLYCDHAYNLSDNIYWFYTEYTEEDGSVTIKIGVNGDTTGHKYYGRVESSFGNFPVEDGTSDLIFESPAADQTYTWNVVVGSTKQIDRQFYKYEMGEDEVKKMMMK